MKEFAAYIAISEKGYPVPFVGYSFQRKMLRETYRLKFGHELKDAGYTILRVRILPEVQA